MRGRTGGYGAVLAERPIRRLLFASLAGRVAFSMLPLGFVLFAVAETGSNATAGALVAAFTVASALAPVRGRIVDRHGPPALVGLRGRVLGRRRARWWSRRPLARRAACWCSSARLAGLVLPPLGPFTRAVWGLALRERGSVLQRAYALDSAGEEAALIVAPLLVAAAVAIASPRAALVVAAVGLLAGTVAAGRSRLAARVALTRARAPRRAPVAGRAVAACSPRSCRRLRRSARSTSPCRRRRASTAAWPRRACCWRRWPSGRWRAACSRAASWRWPPERRVIVLQLVDGRRGSRPRRSRRRGSGCSGAALLVPGAALGALFATLYLLVDRLAPAGSGTRTFAWLVTANNGGNRRRGGAWRGR